MLSQDHNGTQLPIAFAARTFTKGESNKSVIEQELTAIHWAINFFKPYVYGTKFLVKSDHKPLSYLFSLKNPTSKLNRKRLDLEEYDFEIEYIKGKENCGADALSRIDFDQIKKIGSENKHIFQVTTRAQSKLTNKPNIPSIDENARHKKPKVYETISDMCVKILPCIKYNKTKSSIEIFEGKHVLLEVKISNLIDNGKIDLDRFFPRLEKLVVNEGLRGPSTEDFDFFCIFL